MHVNTHTHTHTHKHTHTSCVVAFGPAGCDTSMSVHLRLLCVDVARHLCLNAVKHIQ